MTLFLVGIAPEAFAADAAYTNLHLDAECRALGEAGEDESTVLLCPGLGDIPVFVAESDLRTHVEFGPAGAMRPSGRWESFTQWNGLHRTVEWRVHEGKPFATILRWFIDNTDPETGSTDPARRGQVLVISKIGTDGAPSCHVGYVDALAVRDANDLAREVADMHARAFRCGVDAPTYHGIVGPFAGTPAT